jgi:ABC-2 type transport system ATP-binding protein
MYSIKVQNFTKKYGDFLAVDDISFSVEQGSIFAFLGPNGAGKSTTIGTLCTIQEKTAGELTINGNDVTRQKDLVRKDIGIVFQEPTLDAKLTIAENLKLHCDFYGVPKSEMAKRMDFALDLVALADWKNAQVAGLSGGMKRRAEIARGLVHFPKVLFLDEPTTGLDPQTRANVWDYIRDLQKRKNITIFLTTHYMEEAEICDKVAIIDHGKIVAYDSPYNLKKIHTSTIMKVRTSRPEAFERSLAERSLVFRRDGALLTVHATKMRDIIDLTSSFGESIDDLEINKGTLNDVFIAVTGKEIRE